MKLVYGNELLIICKFDMYLLEINRCKIQITIKKIKNDALLLKFNTYINVTPHDRNEQLLILIFIAIQYTEFILLHVT